MLPVSTSALAALGALVALAAATQLGTTAPDFAQPGTQPGTLTDPMAGAGACTFCHAFFDPVTEPFEPWAGSMMANSMRDPVFHASLAIANQDMAGAGELCLRCHAPMGWLEGRGLPADGSAMTGEDWEGVSCMVCHRMVDPLPGPLAPPVDAAILAALNPAPAETANGKLVIDPLDRRRGPFDLGPSFSWHAWEASPFHAESALCGSCHDVSNPAFVRVGGVTPAPSDTYALDRIGAEHPTHDRLDQFPLERTYSEWTASAFASGPVELGGRFGGNKTAVSSCQDCHMPDTSGEACAPGLGAVTRSDLPQHTFFGANSWVPLSIFTLDASFKLYGPAEATGLPQYFFQATVDGNIAFLQAASDLTVQQDGDALDVRVTNWAGHKLPSGYGEGRRMWLNVRYLDAGGTVVGEHGAYDAFTATLTTADTKVWEVKHGISPAMSTASGEPAGESFHFVLNDEITKDNRIPPLGFTNAAFDAVQAHPVGATYADGQHWDDTSFAIPCGAASAEVAVYHQTTTREYIEFLRDANTTNNTGQIAYDEWVAHGMSSPVTMATTTIPLAPRLAADVDALSTSLGGTQTLCVDAGPQYAGDAYWVLGSFAGTSPGTPVDTVLLPLNVDAYLRLSLDAPQPTMCGVLDGTGRATAALQLRPGTLAALAGLTAHHAYGVLRASGVAATSNPVAVTFAP